MADVDPMTIETFEERFWVQSWVETPGYWSAAFVAESLDGAKSALEDYRDSDPDHLYRLVKETKTVV